MFAADVFMKKLLHKALRNSFTLDPGSHSAEFILGPDKGRTRGLHASGKADSGHSRTSARDKSARTYAIFFRRLLPSSSSSAIQARTRACGRAKPAGVRERARWRGQEMISERSA
jgi:hypothetical protein